MNNVRAWRVEVKWWPRHYSIRTGISSGEVRYSAFLSASDAYDEISIIDFRVRRAPEYDQEAREHWEKFGANGCIGWEDGDTNQRWGVCKKQSEI